ncbi:MAG: hypothetical protein ACTSU9_07070 [Promethearchaeota archaeon]
MHSSNIFVRGDKKFDITLREETGTTKMVGFRYYLKGDNARKLAISKGGYFTFFDNSNSFGPNSNLVKWQESGKLVGNGVLIDGRNWYNDAVSRTHCTLQLGETIQLDKITHINEWYSITATNKNWGDLGYLTDFGDLYDGSDDSVLWSEQLKWYLKFIISGARVHTIQDIEKIGI